MSNRPLRILTRYTRWANQRLFAALATQASNGTTDMLKILAHANIVDQIWRGHLLDRPHGFTSRVAQVIPSLSDLAASQCELDSWYIDYADQLSADQLDEVVNFQFVDGGDGAMSRGDMLLHVANHKTYHRGYVAQMLYGIGSRPPVIDLPVFLRDFPPQF